MIVAMRVENECQRCVGDVVQSLVQFGMKDEITGLADTIPRDKESSVCLPGGRDGSGLVF
jgi:membrane-associated PAP2 superfamily phosphatase